MAFLNLFKKKRELSPNSAVVISPELEQDVIDSLDQHFENNTLTEYEMAVRGDEVIINLVFQGGKANHRDLDDDTE